MKAFLICLSLLVTTSAFAAAGRLEVPLQCGLQMFYPDNGCGNCKTVNRKFMLEGPLVNETIKTNDLTKTVAARDKEVQYSMSGEHNFVHYSINIVDKKTGNRSATQAIYVNSKNGIFANLSDSSGLYISLFCSAP